MPRKDPTSVNLTKKAQEIKDQYADAFGLKNMLSVGLELFNKLTDNEKIKRIAESKANDKTTKISKKKNLRDAIESIKRAAQDDPGIKYLFLSEEESAELRNFQKTFSAQNVDKKAKRG